MKHRPTSQQILTVVNNFRKIPFWCRTRMSFDMNESFVSERPFCGTPHCHGGWYATVSYSREEIKENYICYSSGAHVIARDLGFPNSYEMKNWFSMNPEIWGNENAPYMFSSSNAFYHPKKRPKGAKHVDHVIDHWQEVYERMVQLEENERKIQQEKDIKYPNISEKLAVIQVTGEVKESPDKIEELAHS